MSWLKDKKQFESRLAPVLQGRVTLHVALASAPGAPARGRAWVALDDAEVLSLPIPSRECTAFDVPGDTLDFPEAVAAYLRIPTERARQSGDAILEALYYLDGRTDTRDLIETSGRDLRPLAQALFELRCTLEGIHPMPCLPPPVEEGAPIPGHAEWAGYEKDLDVCFLHGLFFGKSAAEVESQFKDSNAIERSDELLFSPRPVFQYYVLPFAAYLISPAARGDSAAADSFLNLLAAREDRDPGSVQAIYPQLAACVDFVASHQAYFHADIDIFGNFARMAQALRKRCT